MADLPKVGDLARVADECCSSRSVLNQIGHVDAIESFASECADCGFPYSGRFAHIPDLQTRPAGGWFPLHWLRRIPPLADLESIDIADELDTEHPREQVIA